MKLLGVFYNLSEGLELPEKGSEIVARIQGKTIVAWEGRDETQDGQEKGQRVQRFEDSEKELEDFKKRCTVERGYLCCVDVTGLYTLERGEYADGNIILFKPSPDSRLRYVLDRKTMRVLYCHSLGPFESKPALHLCRYLSAVYTDYRVCTGSEGKNGADKGQEGQKGGQKERLKQEALEALFRTCWPVEDESRLVRFAEILAKAGHKKDALMLAL